MLSKPISKLASAPALLPALLTAMVSLLALSGPSHAALFIGTIDNNWFNSGNWDGGAVPTSSDNAGIDDGFSVTATATDAAGGQVNARRLELGNDAGDGVVNQLISEVNVNSAETLQLGAKRFNNGDYSGRIEVNGANVSAGGAEIGFNSLNNPGSAIGELIINNGSLTMGTSTSLTLGQVFQGGGDATGIVQVTNGNVTTNGPTTLTIGNNGSGPGTASAQLRVENGRLQATGGNTTIGFGSSSGAGDGKLELINAEGALGNVTVTNNMNGTGLISLDRSFLDTDNLFLNDGATLEFVLGGATRAAAGATGAGTYGALDAIGSLSQLELGGILDVMFDFTPTADQLVFDLIRLQSGRVFSGAFDAINFLNGPANYDLQTEIVAGSGGFGETFRVTAIAQVPGPATPALLLLGLLVLRSSKRRRSTLATAQSTGTPV